VLGDDKRQAETDKKNADREVLYNRHFSTHLNRTEKPAGFIEQVNGYGVQVFAQATSFTYR